MATHDDDLEPQAPRTAKARAVEDAINDAVGGDEVTTACPECGAVLEVKVLRPDVLVRCPNGHLDAHRRLIADPGWAMRLGFLIAAAIILGLGLVRRFYFEGLPDPHAPGYVDTYTGKDVTDEARNTPVPSATP